MKYIKKNNNWNEKVYGNIWINAEARIRMIESQPQFFYFLLENFQGWRTFLFIYLIIHNWRQTTDGVSSYIYEEFVLSLDTKVMWASGFVFVYQRCLLNLHQILAFLLNCSLFLFNFFHCLEPTGHHHVYFCFNCFVNIYFN